MPSFDTRTLSAADDASLKSCIFHVQFLSTVSSINLLTLCPTVSILPAPDFCMQLPFARVVGAHLLSHPKPIFPLFQLLFAFVLPPPSRSPSYCPTTTTSPSRGGIELATTHWQTALGVVLCMRFFFYLVFVVVLENTFRVLGNRLYRLSQSFHQICFTVLQINGWLQWVRSTFSSTISIG